MNNIKFRKLIALDIQCILLLVVFVLGVGIRIAQINLKDFWYDEAFTYHIANLDSPELFSAVLSDNNPPLYYLLVHFTILFGKTEVVLRTPSLIFNILTALFLYRLTKLIYNKNTAFFATSIFLVSPLAIYFSVETRLHSLGMLLTTLIVFAFLKLLKRENVQNKIFFTVVLTAGLYSQYYIILLLLPIILVLHVNHKLKKHFRLILFPILVFSPWFVVSVFTKHNQCACPNSIYSLPSALVSPFIGGVGEFSLRQFPTLNDEVIVFYYIVAVFGLFMFSRGVTKTIHIIYYLIPLIVVTVFGFISPTFTPKGFSIYLPLLIMVTSFGIYKNSKKYKLFAILFIGMLIVSVTQFVIPEFKGHEIRKLYLKTQEYPALKMYHTSLLTYYSFRYYSKDSNQALLTQNVLSPDTVKFIGGEKTDINQNLDKFWLINTGVWVDTSEYNQVFTDIKSLYKSDLRLRTKDIELSLQTKRF